VAVLYGWKNVRKRCSAFLVVGVVLMCAFAVARPAGTAATSFAFPLDSEVSACGTTIHLSGSLCTRC
jgi:hypothetical protein